MPTAFSLSSWTVEHFKNQADQRVARVVEFLKQQTPDVFALYEVEGKEVFDELTSRMTDYQFHITQGPTRPRRATNTAPRPLQETLRWNDTLAAQLPAIPSSYQYQPQKLVNGERVDQCHAGHMLIGASPPSRTGPLVVTAPQSILA